MNKMTKVGFGMMKVGLALTALTILLPMAGCGALIIVSLLSH